MMTPETKIACSECGFGWNDYTQGQHYSHCSQSPTQPTPDAGEWCYVKTRHGAEVDTRPIRLRAHWDGLLEMEDVRQLMRQIVRDHAAVPKLVAVLERIKLKTGNAILANYAKVSSYQLELQDITSLADDALNTVRAGGE